MALKLITFATDNFRKNAEALKASALAAEFDEAIIFSPDDLKATKFYRENKKILDQKRGAGYWLWKPYIIRKCLRSAAKEDILFYCDAGQSAYYRFETRPNRLIKRVAASDKGVLLGPVIPHLGVLEEWTKRDCLILLNADDKKIRTKPIIMTWSLWTATDFSFSFLDKWLQACCDDRCLTDLPNTLGQANYPKFKDHRHDQSILSILAYQQGVPFLDFSATIVQKAINMRPNSLISHVFYKRPENADALLGGAGLSFLLKQYLAAKTAHHNAI